MRTLPILLAVAAFGCGDNIKLAADGGGGAGGGGVDAPIDSGGGSDAGSDAGPLFPPAPAIGTQIDRMGRPLVASTLVDLIGSGDVDSEVDAYDQNGSPATWVATFGATFDMSLALLDAIDTGFPIPVGVDGSGNPIFAPGGCGNQVLYNGALLPPLGSAAPDSYETITGLMADDELLLDVNSALAGACDVPDSHANYLGVELAVASEELSAGIPHVTCGGRAPMNDAVSASYSAFTMGTLGFANPPEAPLFTPLFGDGATPHADVDDDTFPFLGSAH